MVILPIWSYNQNQSDIYDIYDMQTNTEGIWCASGTFWDIAGPSAGHCQEKLPIDLYLFDLRLNPAFQRWFQICYQMGNCSMNTNRNTGVDFHLFFIDQYYYYHWNLRVNPPPTMPPHPRNKALLREYQPPSSPHKALTRLYFLGVGGGICGVPSGFHGYSVPRWGNKKNPNIHQKIMNLDHLDLGHPMAIFMDP